MTLMRKLERDTLQRQCKKEVEELHQLFVSWFQGTRPREDLEEELNERLQYSFSHVAPNGQFLLGRKVLIKHLEDKYACYKERVFQIDIYNVQLLWNDEVGRCLCTYEEWQSWKQMDEETGEESPVQFGRLSTCLLEKQEHRLSWVHVHETWLEADAPPEQQQTGSAAATAETTTRELNEGSDSVEKWGAAAAMESAPAAAAAAATDKATGGKYVERRPTTYPPHQDADDGNAQLIVLVSSENLGRGDQTRQQEQIFTTLKAHNVPYLEVDGTDFHQRDKRDELFDVSGIRGKYPQLFITEPGSGGKTVYWGDWKKFEAANEAGTVKEEFRAVMESAPAATAAATDKATGGKYVERRPTTYPPHQDTDDGNAQLIVLVSSENLGRGDQTRQQEQIFTTLKAHNVPYLEVDGTDFHQRDKRDELFDVSGIRGKYPQLFITEPGSGGKTVYWGDWKKFEAANEAGTVKEEFRVVVEEGKTATATAAIDANEGALDEILKALTDEGDRVAAVTGASGAEKTAEDEILKFEPEEEVEVKKPRAAKASTRKKEEYVNQEEEAFLQASQGILVFEDEEEEEGPGEPGSQTPEKKQDGESMDNLNVESPIPQDASSKRHLSPKLFKYAEPLKWENALVGISISGFDIGTSQGPIGDETWFKDTGDTFEELAQSRNSPRPRRKICLPEMVFPTAHVALEGHGFWLSWDAQDALEEWARCHHEIAIHSRFSHNGVSVMRAKDAKLWDQKRKHGQEAQGVSSVFHYDWTFSTPFCGKVEGGTWHELDESGMRLSLLTDQSVPILFYDEILLYEDDLHDNGHVDFTVKLRVMPSCCYVLARLWLRVDHVIVRVRETRVLIDFFGMSPQVYRDVTWRECMWGELAANKLPIDVRSWRCNGQETPAWNELLKALPECSLPKGIPKHAVLQL